MRSAWVESLDFDVVSYWCPKAPQPVLDDPACYVHCKNHATFPDKYRAFLCGHFSAVFGTDPADCGGALPEDELGMPTEESTTR